MKGLREGKLNIKTNMIKQDNDSSSFYWKLYYLPYLIMCKYAFKFTLKVSVII